MRLRPSRTWLIALALVLGQWLVLAHAFEHPALASDANCQICVHGQGLDGGTLTPRSIAVALSGTIEAPPPTPRLASARACAERPHIRGPPQA